MILFLIATASSEEVTQSEVTVLLQDSNSESTIDFRCPSLNVEPDGQSGATSWEPAWKSSILPRPYLGIVPEDGGFWDSAWRVAALSIGSCAVDDPMGRPMMFDSALDYYLTTGSPDLLNHNREMFLEFTNRYTFGVDSNLYRWHYKR